MEIEKDNFEDDNELSRLEDEEELGGETQEIVETEEEDRLQDMLRRLAVRLSIPFYVWTPIEGLTRPPIKSPAN